MAAERVVSFQLPVIRERETKRACVHAVSLAENGTRNRTFVSIVTTPMYTSSASAVKLLLPLNDFIVLVLKGNDKCFLRITAKFEDDKGFNLVRNIEESSLHRNWIL